ncbi:hypothetical protein [Phenylobacterium sp. J367]|uniref:hypothetical protein n=1 Tax=Phenylobacterium sp. J367 TaxID=2898435 RepID=UPI0021519B22|nr:hypothetical protein [Phenylobacterium sp. J367]MCR5880515.1 hypothetical protein [Phenylobacterium sp. J367]
MWDDIQIEKQFDQFTTVLVVRTFSENPDSLVADLTDAGVNVLGPVDTAAKALTLVAQTPVDLALVSAKLAGRRSGAELARCLEDTWGVPPVLLP